MSYSWKESQKLSSSDSSFYIWWAKWQSGGYCLGLLTPLDFCTWVSHSYLWFSACQKITRHVPFLFLHIPTPSSEPASSPLILDIYTIPLGCGSETWISFLRLPSLEGHQSCLFHLWSYLTIGPSVVTPMTAALEQTLIWMPVYVRCLNRLPACSVTCSWCNLPIATLYLSKMQSGTPFFQLKRFQWPEHICWHTSFHTLLQLSVYFCVTLTRL